MIVTVRQRHMFIMGGEIGGIDASSGYGLPCALICFREMPVINILHLNSSSCMYDAHRMSQGVSMSSKGSFAHASYFSYFYQ